MLDLLKATNDVNDVVVKKGIEWITKTVGGIAGGGKEGKEEGKEVERERRKREARERAMERMKANARNFMVDMDVDMEEEEEDEGGGATSGESKEGDGGVAGLDRFLPKNEEKCIICNSSASDEAMLYCCYIQPSTVLNGARPPDARPCGPFRDGR
jgi:hypothetical protein